MRATKRQKAAALRLVELAREADDLLGVIGPCSGAAFYVAQHAVDTLRARAKELRIALLTVAEYQEEESCDD